MDPVWWFRDAACSPADRHLFLAARNHHDVARAKAICYSCPVRELCLLYGAHLEYPSDRFGVFGGTSAHERNEMFKGVDQDTLRLRYEVERDHLLAREVQLHVVR